MQIYYINKYVFIICPCGNRYKPNSREETHTEHEQNSVPLLNADLSPWGQGESLIIQAMWVIIPFYTEKVSCMAEDNISTRQSISATARCYMTDAKKWLQIIIILLEIRNGKLFNIWNS